MLEKKDVEKLANLSRINITEDEKEELKDDLENILGYVSEVQEVVVGDVGPEVGKLYNVMREDQDPHKSGEFSKEIMEEAPNTKDCYVKVKKIL